MILILDGHNLMHRARSGFQLGEFFVVFNFVRQLRALVDKFAPSRVYLTLEGAPKRQLALLPEYKTNRGLTQADMDDPKKVAAFVSFQEQKKVIIELLDMLPIAVVQHPDFEADDLIYNLVKRSSTAIEFTVVSTDTDFLQMLQEFGNVKLYNPITKKHAEPPEYDYVTWKSLRGDSSDNVPGLPGIGDVRAAELASDLESLRTFLRSNPVMYEQFARNIMLIGLVEWSDEQALGMRCSSGSKRDWDLLKERFESMAFRSLLKEGAWAKFCGTFDSLWG